MSNQATPFHRGGSGVTFVESRSDSTPIGRGKVVEALTKYITYAINPMP